MCACKARVCCGNQTFFQRATQPEPEFSGLNWIKARICKRTPLTLKMKALESKKNPSFVSLSNTTACPIVSKMTGKDVQ